MELSFLNKIRVLAVVCTQFGDTGKGKIVDLLSNWADVIVRGTGGANAGHTICLNGKQYVLHLVPCGILHPKLNIIGSGVVIDPHLLAEEIAMLQTENIDCETRLRVACNAKLVCPQHMALDMLQESSAGRIGTTHRGIGPAYADHVGRRGLVLADILNPDILAQKLRSNLEWHTRMFRSYDAETVATVMRDERLMSGTFYDPKTIFNVDAIIAHLIECGKKIRVHIANTNDVVAGLYIKANGRFLLEGAQGNLLSVDYGTYPFVTSSDATIAGLAKGAGLSERCVDRIWALVKTPYMTRVGAGPFPTKIGNGWSGRKEEELEKYPTASLNDEDVDVMAVALRRAGNEYGATTGRPRDVGWLDLPLLRYSLHTMRFHKVSLALMKLDVLRGCNTIKICTDYHYEGPRYQFDGLSARDGGNMACAYPQAEVLSHCRPLYETFTGWEEDIRGVRHRKDLPQNLLRIIQFIEDKLDLATPIVLLSVGPDREETILN